MAITIGRNRSDAAALLAAESLLAWVGVPQHLVRTSITELTQIKGVTEEGAIQLKAALELGRRLMRPPLHERPTIRTPADAANVLIPELMLLEQEHMCTLLLDRQSRLIANPTIYIGSLNTAVVRIAEIFKEGVRQNASSLVLSHNHPSGDPTPSPEDVQVTRQIVAAGNLLGIEVLDHVVIGGASFVSLRERGLGFTV